MEQKLVLPSSVFAQAFHPSKNFYAVALVSGVVRVYSYTDPLNPQSYVVRYETQEKSACRELVFNEDYLLYGMGECDCVCLSVMGFVEAFRTEPRYGVGVSSLLWLSSESFCVGCDDGLIQIYDMLKQRELRAEIREFDICVTDMVLHPDGDKFYALGGTQLGLFNIASQDHGTRLIAMSDEATRDYAKMILMENGKKILCCCDEDGVAIFHEGDLGTHKERISGIKYCLFSIVKLSEEFFLTAGETGQVIVGQINPNQFIGVFDELMDLHQGHDTLSDDLEETCFVVDSMAIDRERKIITFVENIDRTILFRPLKPALDICEGAASGKKTNYADFMNDL